MNLTVKILLQLFNLAHSRLHIKPAQGSTLNLQVVSVKKKQNIRKNTRVNDKVCLA